MGRIANKYRDHGPPAWTLVGGAVALFAVCLFVPESWRKGGVLGVAAIQVVTGGFAIISGLRTKRPKTGTVDAPADREPTSG